MCKKYIFILIIFVLSQQNGLAQWVQRFIPNHKAVRCFVVKDDKLFAGTDDGVFVSYDNGGNWSSVNNNLTDDRITSFAIIDKNLFVGTLWDGVFLSTDDGLNWTPANTGIGGGVLSLYADGTELYAGTFAAGLYKSTDNGSSWSIKGFSNSTTSSFIRKDSLLFIGCWATGVFRSEDSGNTWTQVKKGLTNTYVTALESIDNYLFAGTYAGVFRSSDNGINWEAVNNGITDTVTVPITCLKANGGWLFAGTMGWGGRGIFCSTDYGANWKTVNTGLTELDIYYLTIKDSLMFAGTYTGVWSRPVSDFTTNIDDKEIYNDSYNLFQNYPNPFNPSTTIHYSIPAAGNVNITIYNALGVKVGVLVNEYKLVGNYEIEWNPSHAASGIYFYQLRLGNIVETKKMTLLR